MSGPDRLVVQSTGAGETRELAAIVAHLCRPGDVMLLAGGLGVGKTTFAQGFAVGLGVAETVTSPTFTLVRQYPVDRHPITTFLHADVYRLDHLQEVVDLGLAELVGDGGVALVEWGDAAAPVLGRGALTVRLETDLDDDECRTISLGPPGETWSTRWKVLEANVAACGGPGEDVVRTRRGRREDAGEDVVRTRCHPSPPAPAPGTDDAVGPVASVLRPALGRQ